MLLISKGYFKPTDANFSIIFSAFLAFLSITIFISAPEYVKNHPTKGWKITIYPLGGCSLVMST